MPITEPAPALWGWQAEVTWLSRCQDEPWELALHQEVTCRSHCRDAPFRAATTEFPQPCNPGSLSEYALCDSPGSTGKQQWPRKHVFETLIGTSSCPRGWAVEGPHIWHLSARDRSRHPSFPLSWGHRGKNKEGGEEEFPPWKCDS